MTAFFWGGTFIAGRMLADHVDPYAAAFLRFFIASFFLIILTIRLENRLPGISLKTGGIIFLLGLTGVFFYNICFFTGLKYIQANQASLIIACNPIFITFFSSLIFKEKLTTLKSAGIAISVFGALTVISNGNPGNLFAMGTGKGELLIFGCVASWVIYSILGKKAMVHLSPVATVCYSSIAGTLMLGIPAMGNQLFSRITSYSATVWGCLIYLGVFGTVLGFIWYYQGIRDIGPTKAGIFINFVPVSAIFLSFFILDEPITPSLILGTIFVITGVYLTNRPQPQKKER